MKITIDWARTGSKHNNNNNNNISGVRPRSCIISFPPCSKRIIIIANIRNDNRHYRFCWWKYANLYRGTSSGPRVGYGCCAVFARPFRLLSGPSPPTSHPEAIPPPCRLSAFPPGRRRRPDVVESSRSRTLFLLIDPIDTRPVVGAYARHGVC